MMLALRRNLNFIIMEKFQITQIIIKKEKNKKEFAYKQYFSKRTVIKYNNKIKLHA